MTKLNLATDGAGNIRRMPIEDCHEVVRRMVERNADPTSTDYESLTWVQEFALCSILETAGIKVSLPWRKYAAIDDNTESLTSMEAAI